MIVSLTYSCSMGCSHCMSDCRPCNAHMSSKTLDDVLHFLIKTRQRIWAFSGGEIFEHPDICDILVKISQKLPNNAILMLITNGRKLGSDMAMYDQVRQLIKVLGKNRVLIQVTDDSRFYPNKLDEKQKYRLKTLGAVIDSVPGDGDKCLYPQGRAAVNFDESWWNTKAPKCTNVRAIAKQLKPFGLNSIYQITNVLAEAQKFCTPVISPSGLIKLGESALCPNCSSIYKEEHEILEDILNFKCSNCTYAVNKLKQSGQYMYKLVFEQEKEGD